MIVFLVVEDVPVLAKQLRLEKLVLQCSSDWLPSDRAGTQG